jgi:hypothetical protein
MLAARPSAEASVLRPWGRAPDWQQRCPVRLAAAGWPAGRLFSAAVSPGSDCDQPRRIESQAGPPSAAQSDRPELIRLGVDRGAADPEETRHGCGVDQPSLGADVRALGVRPQKLHDATRDSLYLVSAQPHLSRNVRQTAELPRSPKGHISGPTAEQHDRKRKGAIGTRHGEVLQAREPGGVGTYVPTEPPASDTDTLCTLPG